MRLFSGVSASIVVSLLLGFFTSVSEAQQNPCDPDSESYDVRVCFEYVNALEAKNAKATRDLAAVRRETSVVKSQLKAVENRHKRTAMNLGFDIELRDRVISSLGTQIRILSEEKETAWGYVRMFAEILSAVIGFSIFGGILGSYLLRKRVSDYALEVRDEKIHELENTLHIETDARIMAQGDAAALRLELFHKNLDLARVRKNYADLLKYVRQEMVRFATIRETLYRTLSLLQTSGSRLEKLSDLAQPHATV